MQADAIGDAQDSANAEQRAARDQAQARAWGDAVLAAESSGDPAAIMGVDPQGAESRRILGAMIAASEWSDKGDEAAATDALRNVAGDAAAGTVLHDLAELKLVMLQGDSMDPAQRDEILSRLSRAGAPFELLALEQPAVAVRARMPGQEAANRSTMAATASPVVVPMPRPAIQGWFIVL